MGLLDFLFGDNKKLIKEALDKKGSIIDVRTVGEFNMGNIKGSLNIPLDKISSSKNKISKLKQPIIVYCQSGSRSASAKMMLKGNGFTEVLNGGSISSLSKLMNG